MFFQVHDIPADDPVPDLAPFNPSVCLPASEGGIKRNVQLYLHGDSWANQAKWFAAISIQLIMIGKCIGTGNQAADDTVDRSAAVSGPYAFCSDLS